MLWAALTLAAGCAGWAVAAGGLRLRSTRLAVPVHALGLALAFGGCGAGCSVLSQGLGQDGSYPATMVLCGQILGFMIFPSCVGIALITSLYQSRPLVAMYATIPFMLTFLVPAIRPSLVNLLFVAALSAVLVAPTYYVHQLVRRIPPDQVNDRFLTACAWTAINSLLVLGCGQEVDSYSEVMD